MARVLGFLVLAFAAGFVPAAHADDHLDVVINGQSTVSIASSDLSHDVGLQRCTVRSGSGDTTNDIGDTSLKSIAADAGVPAEAVDSMKVQDRVAISGDEVRHGFNGDHANPSCSQAVVLYNGDEFGFFRPLRGGGDTNAGDQIELQIHETMRIDLTTNSTTLRTVRVHPDTTTPDAGADDGFSATIDDHGNGDPYSYAWDFGDGTTSTESSPAHPFRPGRWLVRVTATGSDGSVGVARPVAITVKGPPSSTPTSTATPTAAGTEAGSDNPTAPPGGQESPTVGPIGSPTPGVTGTPTVAPRTSSTPRPHASSTPTPRASQTPTPTSTSTPRVGATSNTFGDPAPAPATTGVATPAPKASATQPPSGKKARGKPTPTPTQTQTPQPTGPGVPVSGVLLAGVGDRTDLAQILRSIDQTQATATERPQVRRGTSGSTEWLGPTSGGGLLLLLLAAGAARERRRIAA